MPGKDSWSTPYIIRVTRYGYLIASAGPNRRTNGEPGKDGDDIVFQNGSFTQPAEAK